MCETIWFLGIILLQAVSGQVPKDSIVHFKCRVNVPQQSQQTGEYNCLGAIIAPMVILTTSYCAVNCYSININGQIIPFTKVYTQPFNYNYVQDHIFGHSVNYVALVLVIHDVLANANRLRLSALEIDSTIGLKALFPVVNNHKLILQNTLITFCDKDILKSKGYFICTSNKLHIKKYEKPCKSQLQGTPLIVGRSIIGISGVRDEKLCKHFKNIFMATGPCLHWITSTIKGMPIGGSYRRTPATQTDSEGLWANTLSTTAQNTNLTAKLEAPDVEKLNLSLAMDYAESKHWTAFHRYSFQANTDNDPKHSTAYSRYSFKMYMYSRNFSKRGPMVLASTKPNLFKDLSKTLSGQYTPSPTTTSTASTPTKTTTTFTTTTITPYTTSSSTSLTSTTTSPPSTSTTIATTTPTMATTRSSKATTTPSTTATTFAPTSASKLAFTFAPVINSSTTQPSAEENNEVVSLNPRERVKDPIAYEVATKAMDWFNNIVRSKLKEGPPSVLVLTPPTTDDTIDKFVDLT